MHGAEGTSAYNSSLLRNICIPIKVFGNKRVMMGYDGLSRKGFSVTFFRSQFSVARHVFHSSRKARDRVS